MKKEVKKRLVEEEQKKEWKRYEEFIEKTNKAKSQYEFDKIIHQTSKFKLEDILSFWVSEKKITPPTKWEWEYGDFLGVD